MPKLPNGFGEIDLFEYRNCVPAKGRRLRETLEVCCLTTCLREGKPNKKASSDYR